MRFAKANEGNSFETIYTFIFQRSSCVCQVALSYICGWSTNYNLAVIHFMEWIINWLWEEKYGYLLPIWIWLSDSQDLGCIRNVCRVKPAMFVSKFSGSATRNELFWKQDKWTHIASKDHTENLSNLYMLHLNDLKQICSLCSDSAVRSFCCSQHGHWGGKKCVLC